jgi:putative Holliday junction resolvase
MAATTGRIMAVDYGKKNIGLAYCDELGITIQPLPSLPNAGLKEFIKRLQSAVQSLEIRHLVLGMPLNMDGTQGEAFARMQQILETLRAKLTIPLSGVDERLSTVEAADIWNTMGRRQQKKYRTIDSLAAALILERYLKETES